MGKPKTNWIRNALAIFQFGKTFFSSYWKKSLKMPKELSESVYWRRTDNTMAKRKSTKWQTTIYRNMSGGNGECGW